MASDEEGFPIVAHEVATGEDCCGCLIIQVRRDQADIICNECGAVIRTLPAERARAVMLEMASGAICSARCNHCDALNTFPGFSDIEACICAECGESVVVNVPLQ
jgi:hypothetical protein